MPVGFPAAIEWLAHEGTAPMREDVEKHITNRGVLAGMTDPFGTDQVVPSLQRAQAGPVVLQDDQLTVDDGAGRKAAEHLQLGVAAAVVD